VISYKPAELEKLSFHHHLFRNTLRYDCNIRKPLRMTLLMCCKETFFPFSIAFLWWDETSFRLCGSCKVYAFTHFKILIHIQPNATLLLVAFFLVFHSIFYHSCIHRQYTTTFWWNSPSNLTHVANFIIGTIDPRNSFFQRDDDDDVVKNDVDHFCNRSIQYFYKMYGKLIFSWILSL